MNGPFWWYVARSSGIAAWALAMASVLWGTALATRALGRKPGAPWLQDLHRHLGGLTVLFVGVHLGALVADSYVHFGLADLLVPGASGWRTGAVAWGIVAFWLLLAIEVTSLLRRRLSKRWWRGIHLTSYAVAVLTTVHLFTAGTDATTTALRWVTLGVGGILAFLLLYRWLGPRAPRRELPARPRRDSPVDDVAPDRPYVGARDGEHVRAGGGGLPGRRLHLGARPVAAAALGRADTGRPPPA